MIGMKAERLTPGRNQLNGRLGELKGSKGSLRHSKERGVKKMAVFVPGHVPTNKIVIPRDLLEQLYLETGSSKIAKKLKISKQTVLRNLHEYDIAMRQSGAPEKLPEEWKKSLRKPKSKPAWNKGLTKENNESLKQISNNTKGERNHKWKHELHTSEKALCACGCGQLRNKYDVKGRERKYIRGHSKGGYFEEGFNPWNKEKKMPGWAIKRGKEAAGYKDGRTLVVNHCIDCGEEVSYSSVRCVKCAHKMELNSSWLGGKSFEPYGNKFNDELKEKIRKRDNYTCQECGYAQEELGYALSVHHIDYNKKNSILDNLVSLCKSCHQKTNFNREDWINYFQIKNEGVKHGKERDHEKERKWMRSSRE